MLSKVRAELDEALKKAQTSSAAEMTAKEELKEQALLAKEVIVISVFFQNDRNSFSLGRDILLKAALHVQLVLRCTHHGMYCMSDESQKFRSLINDCMGAQEVLKGMQLNAQSVQTK